MAELKIFRNQQEKPIRYPLNSRVVSIGRSGENDLKLEDPLASRFHCQVTTDEDRFFIEDTNSKHGTFLNGDKINRCQELRCGDRIRIGWTDIGFFTESDSINITEELPAKSVQTSTFPISQLIAELNTDEEIEKLLAGASKLQFRAEAFRVLRDFSIQLLSQNQVQTILESTLEFVGKVVSARRGILMLKNRDSDSLETRATESFSDKVPKKLLTISRSIVQAVLDNKASLITPDAQLDKRFQNSDSIFEQDIHSAICAPLWNNKEVSGLIYLDRDYTENPFNQEDLYLVSSLANMAAIKIDNIRLFRETLEKKALEEQLALAADIQRRLLPDECPVITGFDIAACHEPCLQIGGDYYDFFMLSDQRLAIALGDVSGKGPSAALLMATLRAALCSQIKLGRPKGELFQNLNEFIFSSSVSGKYITFFYCEISLKNMEFWYVNAGHNAPVIVRKGGGTDKLPATGLPLGLFPGKIWEQKKTVLHSGDILILFTDGITESINQSSEEFGEERMLISIRRNSHLTASAILDDMLKQVRVFEGAATQHDDRTAVVLKANHPAQSNPV